MSHLTRPLAQRAVHLRITPPPSSLAESRQVLRLLTMHFGAVDYFRAFRLDSLPGPESAVVVFRDEEAAKRCLRRSPLRVRFGEEMVVGALEGAGRVRGLEQEVVEEREEEGGSESEANEDKMLAWGVVGLDGEVEGKARRRRYARPPGEDGWGLGAETETDEKGQRSTTTASSQPKSPSPNRQDPAPAPSNAPFSPFPSPPSSPTDPTQSPNRITQILARPSSRRFRDHIDSAHYHGSYALDTGMFGQGDLARRVPVIGLSCVDWRASEKPWRLVRAQREGVGGLGLWDGEAGAGKEEAKKSSKRSKGIASGEGEGGKRGEKVESEGKKGRTLMYVWEQGMVRLRAGDEKVAGREASG